MDEPDFTRIRPVKVRARLPVSVEDAFAFVADPTNDPQWVDTTPHVEQTDGDGPVIGATYAFDQTVLRDVTGEIVITDMAAPAFVAFRTEDPLRIYRVEYRLSAKGDGCVFEQSSYPWFKSAKLRKKTWMARFLIRKQVRKQMRALRDVLAESSA